MNRENFRIWKISNFTSPQCLQALIEDCIDAGASDIHINADDFIRFEVHGRFYCVSKHRLDNTEVVMLCNGFYKSDTGSEMVMGGESLDHSFQHRYITGGEAKNYNFRVNTVAATCMGRIVITTTIRPIDEEPPIWDEMGYGSDLWNAWRPSNGIVVVSGATGTGKTTLLASGLRRILEERENEKIITLESPIEFLLKKYQTETTMVVQRSIPQNRSSFLKGVEDSLRQHPTIIVVGECRKKEEIMAALLASISGHLIYTTTHSNSAPEALFRMLNEFPADEQRARLGDLIYASRLYVNQRLLPSTDGKRVAIREIIEIDSDVSNKLEKCRPDQVKSEMRKMIGEYGQSFSQHANFYLKQGLITDEQYNLILKDERGEMK